MTFFDKKCIHIDEVLTEEEAKQKREEKRAIWLNTIRSEETQISTYTEDTKVSIDETLLEKAEEVETETKKQRKKWMK